MNIIKRVLRSSIGLKFIMAGTGIGLFFFVLLHLVGNLQFFLGRDTINAYGHMFQDNEKLRWPFRIGLLLTVGLHGWSALRLTALNRASRPLGYDGDPAPVAASYASRTMLMSGLILAAFIIYHLLHFTVRLKAVNLVGADFEALTEPSGHGHLRHDIFHMMVLGFRHPLVSGFYLLGVGLLCLHLSHGIRAVFQSLGFKNRKWDPVIDTAAPLIAWLMFLGYSSIPVAVMLGFGSSALH